MRILFFSLMMISLFVLRCEISSSGNYSLVQSVFSSGQNHSDSFQNYYLSNSSTGNISGIEATSSEMIFTAGYYMGELYDFIISPENVTIEIISNQKIIIWNAVTGAASYSVYSSADPYADFSAWTLETSGETGTIWSDLNATGTKKFYVVVAVN